MYLDNFLAEESIFAEILIEHRKVEQTDYQKNIDFISYMHNTATSKSTVNNEEYRIINMPDTMAYIPKHSIFENIILFHSDYADFRFVPVNRVVDGLTTADNIPAYVINNDIQPVDAPVSKRRKVGTSLITSTLSNIQSTADPKFADLNGQVRNISGYNAMVNQIRKLIQKHSQSIKNEDWIQDLYRYNKYSKEFISNVLANESTIGDNFDSLIIRTIDSIKSLEHDAELSSATIDAVYNAIRTLINTYSVTAQNDADTLKIAEERVHQNDIDAEIEATNVIQTDEDIRNRVILPLNAAI